MSTRAYKLIEIKTADSPTFNCWHDGRIMDLNRQDDNGDIVLINKDDAENLLKEIQNDIKLNHAITDEGMDELKYLSNCLKQIIKDCDGEDYAEYYCF